MLRFGWHGIDVLAVMMEEDKEERLFKRYVADCIGTIVRQYGADGLPLFSEILKPSPSTQSPQQILNHVKKIFAVEEKLA